MKHMTSSRRISVLLVFGATLSSVAFGQTAMFSVKQLANIPGATQAFAKAINNSGDVVGYVSGSLGCGIACAVIWINGTPNLLGAVAGATSTYPSSINNAGLVAGTAYGQGIGNVAVTWNNGTPTLLPAGEYSNASSAASINDAGQVVGGAGGSAIEWNGLTQTVLGLVPGYTAGYAYGVNNNNLVVGASCCDNTEGRAVVWHGTVPSLLPQISSGGGTAAAYAVNNSGLAVGQAGFGGGYYAAAWANGVVTDLGALVQQSAAYAVNNRGIIVGESDSAGAGGFHAVLWSRIGAPIQDLNTLISARAASEVILTEAYAINDNCTIVASGLTNKKKVYTALLLILNDPSQCVNGL
jgi:uncharacterized membrane protein